MTTKAKALAWNLYLRAAQETVNNQFDRWNRGEVVGGVVLAVPTAARVALIEQALQAAVDEGIHAALGPVVSALDAIDNGSDKSPAMKRQRAAIQKLYDALHAMKSTDYKLAT